MFCSHELSLWGWTLGPLLLLEEPPEQGMGQTEFAPWGSRGHREALWVCEGI